MGYSHSFFSRSLIFAPFVTELGKIHTEDTSQYVRFVYQKTVLSSIAFDSYESCNAV